MRRENVLRVSRELAVPLRTPARWMDSRPAMAVALALAGTDAEPAWRERVWSGVYDEARSLDDAGELGRLAADLGLDQKAVELGNRTDALELCTLECIDADVTGVPTFMLDGWPIGGIQTDETMRSLLGRYAARMRDGSRI